MAWYYLGLVFIVVGIFALPPIPDIKDPDGEERGERVLFRRDASHQEAPLPLTEGHRATDPLDPQESQPQSSSAGNAENSNGNVFSESDFEYAHQVIQPEVDTQDSGTDQSVSDQSSATHTFGSHSAGSSVPSGSGTHSQYGVQHGYDRYETGQDSQTRQYGTGNRNNLGQTGYSEYPNGRDRTSSSSLPSTGRYVPTGSNTRQVYTAGGSGGGRDYGTGAYPSGGQRGSTYNTDTSVDHRTYYGNSQGGSYYPRQGSQIRPSVPDTFDPSRTYISQDPNCPTTDSRILINGMSCPVAVSTLGPFVCYNYERVSRECCQSCLALKQPSNIGCEYGDKSYQCRNIESFDCYVERNRNICCDRCRQYHTDSRQGCEYGDLTPRCQIIRQRPHLCYLRENQRLCCVTCPRLADQSQPDCEWGNQNPDLCQPFDSTGRLRLNCYQSAVQQVCCATCKSLRERITSTPPGCEYGDSPVQFSTGRGILDCASYLREYGVDNCDNEEVAGNCCHTCYRYRHGG